MGNRGREPGKLKHCAEVLVFLTAVLKLAQVVADLIVKLLP